MTEQRVKTAYPNIKKFLGKEFSSSQLYSIVKKGLLVKDENNYVIYGLTDIGYQFLSEYSHYVTCEQDAEELGFYSTSLQINVMLKGVAV